MSNKLDGYAVDIGLSIIGGSTILSGNGAPGGDGNSQDIAPLGSIYLRKDTAKTYQKIANTNNPSDWTLLARVSDVGNIVLPVSQTSHGFSEGMPITKTSGTWIQSNAGSNIASADAIVSSVIDANNFIAQTAGNISLTTGQWDLRTGDTGGLIDGEYYFLSLTSGKLTRTVSSAGYFQSLLKAINSTTAIIEIGDVFSAPFSSGVSYPNRIIIPFNDGIQSTTSDSTSKRIVGQRNFDPTLLNWGINSTSTITLYMLLQTSNAANPANADIYRESGVGAPVLVATLPSTTNLTAALLSVDVSAAFRPTTGSAGIFDIRMWITTANGNDYATCSSAWIEIQL